MVVRIENLTSTVRAGPVGNLTAEQVEEIVRLVGARLQAKEPQPKEHERGDDGALYRSALPPLRTD
ncbi:hypothetical protein AB0H36_41770 [Kribbella sp. NPDC050820]|uniref:hypothetical protein n=1 Tax=Kribbella sp. NPDC050820 TaxID=3155408 RepID=UPI0033D6C747